MVFFTLDELKLLENIMVYSLNYDDATVSQLEMSRAMLAKVRDAIDEKNAQAQ